LKRKKSCAAAVKTETAKGKMCGVGHHWSTKKNLEDKHEQNNGKCVCRGQQGGNSKGGR